MSNPLEKWAITINSARQYRDGCEEDEIIADLADYATAQQQRIAALEAQLAEARAERWQPVDKLEWEQVPMPLAYDMWRHLVAQEFFPRDDGYSYALMRRKLTGTTPGEGSQ